MACSSAKPKTLSVGAGAIIRPTRCRGPEILLLRREFRGVCYWTLPGGVQKSGESIGQCVIREMFEEIRCRVTLVRNLGVCSGSGVPPDEVSLTVFLVIFEGENSTIWLDERSHDKFAWMNWGDIRSHFVEITEVTTTCLEALSNMDLL